LQIATLKTRGDSSKELQALQGRLQEASLKALELQVYMGVGVGVPACMCVSEGVWVRAHNIYEL